MIRSNRTTVYIAGPLSSGDRDQNVKNAIAAGVELIRAGYAPFIPHLTNFVDPDDSLGHDTWVEVDLPWVAMADVVLRLPGYSKGADEECHWAEMLDIPIYYSVAELIAAVPNTSGKKSW